MNIYHDIQSRIPYGATVVRPGVWMLHNRDYHPLGIHSTDFVKCEDHPEAHFELTHYQEKKLRALAIETCEKGIWFYRYGDGITALADPNFIQRLYTLANLIGGLTKRSPSRGTNPRGT